MKVLTRRDYLILPWFFLGGVGILAYHFFGMKSKPQLSVGQDLNLDDFERYVLEAYPKTREAAISLIVFLDPVSDCPVCLAEAPFWVEPLKIFPRFNVIFFIGDAISDKDVLAFQEALGLSGDHIQRYDEASPVSQFHERGVFKVLYSEKSGVLWYQPGSRNESEYEAFAQTLKTSLEHLHP